MISIFVTARVNKSSYSILFGRLVLVYPLRKYIYMYA